MSNLCRKSASRCRPVRYRSRGGGQAARRLRRAARGREALVIAVAPDSPADDAGFEPGCYVTTVDGRPRCATSTGAGLRPTTSWIWATSISTATRASCAGRGLGLQFRRRRVRRREAMPHPALLHAPAARRYALLAHLTRRRFSPELSRPSSVRNLKPDERASSSSAYRRACRCTPGGARPMTRAASTCWSGCWKAGIEFHAQIHDDVGRPGRTRFSTHRAAGIHDTIDWRWLAATTSSA